MRIDSLTSLFTIGHIQCVSHTLMHSSWETHLDGQNKLSLQLGGSALQSLLDCPNHELTVGNLSTYKEPITSILCATLNAPKSCRAKCSN